METQPENVVDTEFDPFEFWDRNKGRILLFGALLVIALGLFITYRIISHRTQVESQRLFAQAETAEGYEKVLALYPASQSAAKASLLLAAEQRQNGKFDDAQATLNRFLSQFPEHPLVAGAWLSLAETDAAAGRTEAALAGYQKIVSQFPKSYAAPLAQIGSASLLKAQGKTAEARQAYETLMSQFPESIYSRQAQQELQFLP